MLDDDDSSLPFLNAVFPSIAIAAMLATAYALLLYKASRHHRHQLLDRRNMFISTLISVNVVYILCYFCLYMLLAFLDNPLVTFSTYFIIVIAILCWFYLLLMSGTFSIHVAQVIKMIAIQSKVTKCLLIALIIFIAVIVGVASTRIYTIIIIIFYVIIVLSKVISSQLYIASYITFLPGRLD